MCATAEYRVEPQSRMNEVKPEIRFFFIMLGLFLLWFFGLILPQNKPNQMHIKRNSTTADQIEVSHHSFSFLYVVVVGFVL